MIDSWGFYLWTPEHYVESLEELTPEVMEEVYEHWLDILAKTEDWGFTGLTFAEHHFLPNSLNPSPHIVIATLLGRTKKLRFSTAGSVLSMHYAWRYAEEIGMLRYISKGRFEPGVAPGSGPTEAIMAGFRAEEVRPRYESGLEILQEALTGEPLTHHDDYYDLDELKIVPPWRPTPGAQDTVWATVLSPESAAKTAERGWKLLTGWLSTDVLAAVGARYREAARACGNSTDPSMLAIRRRVFVADSDAEAQDKFEAATDLMPFLLRTDGSQMEASDPRVAAMIDNPDDFAIGSPETVAEKLIEQCKQSGFGNVMAWPDFASFSWADLERSHELYGTKVLPALRSAKVDADWADAQIADKDLAVLTEMDKERQRRHEDAVHNLQRR